MSVLEHTGQPFWVWFCSQGVAILCECSGAQGAAILCECLRCKGRPFSRHWDLVRGALGIVHLYCLFARMVSKKGKDAKG